MPSVRALNRSLLARQGLLERVDVGVEAMVERLVGMQAQIPGNPYVGLWSRVAGFTAPALSERVADGTVVRAQLMRSTIHLVSAADHDAFYAPMLPCQQRHYSAQWRRRMGGADLGAVVAAGRRHLAEGPRSRGDLDALLAAEFPGAEKGALAMAATLHVPCVQAPPRGEWGVRAMPRQAIREPAGEGASVDEIIRRYVAAFGPVSVADMRSWSGLTGLRAVADRLDLIEVDGLLDVPGAPWPDEDTPAPPRFLPEFDNAVLAHADRSRIVARPVALPPGGVRGTVLIDGFVAAAWGFDGERVTVSGEPDGAVAAEADALGAFLRSGA